MRLFPVFVLERLLAGQLVKGAVQPPMPVRSNTRCLNLAVEDHPATAVIGIVIKHIALIILANLDPLTGGKDLGVERLTIPPGHGAQKSVQGFP